MKDIGVEFIVPGPPATKGSTVSFVGKLGRIVTKTDCRGLKAWSESVGWAAKFTRLQLANDDTPVRITAVFQFPHPTRVARLWPTVRPDLDKLLRALLDALTGVAYADDAQVVELTAQKVYGADARTTVRISRVE